MPEYLAPGVYVEETSFRSKSIEGVSTSTTAFVGPTRYGPIAGEPELITSYAQFERIYGGLDPLDFGGGSVTNYMAHAVNAFFGNGGARLYVARAYTAPQGGGRGQCPIPATIASVEDARALATTATAAGLRALDEAGADLIAAQNAAMAVLQYAAGRVLAARPQGAPAPAINFDYGAGNNVKAQLDAFIAGLPQQADRDAVQAELDQRDALITGGAGNAAGGDAIYAATRAALAQPDPIRANVDAAMQAGVIAGSPAQVADAALPDNATASAQATTSHGALTATANGITAARDAMRTAADALTAARRLPFDDARAETARAAAEALRAAAVAVRVAVSAAAPDIQDAARTATIGARVALATATAMLHARFPGAAGNMDVIVTGRIGSNAFAGRNNPPELRQVREGDLVVVNRRAGAAPISSVARVNGAWVLRGADGLDTTLTALPNNAEVYPLRLSVQINLPGKFAQPLLWTELTVSTRADRAKDSVTGRFDARQSNRTQELETPLILDPQGAPAPTLAGLLIGLADGDWRAKLDAAPRVSESSATYRLTGGSDGARPDPAAYKGSEMTAPGSEPLKTGLLALEDLEDISIVAAPGCAFDYSADAGRVDQINQEVITHAEKMRYRVAILDSPPQQGISGIRAFRGPLSSSRAALYYPWVRVFDPVMEQQVDVPPSGFLAGIYARNDNENGVHKAPANEALRGAIGLETMINKGQQEVLNPLGINCLRYFENRGRLVWGARTLSPDPEWKYLNIRRYFIFLEASIDRSTQWAVFRPNGEALWANVRRAVEDFLFNEWKEGHLAGTKPEEAYFVKCDRSTMSQNDLDNGRMICLIGVAPLYPAEFVIFRIGQWTADRPSRT